MAVKQELAASLCWGHPGKMLLLIPSSVIGGYLVQCLGCLLLGILYLGVLWFGLSVAWARSIYDSAL